MHTCKHASLPGPPYSFSLKEQGKSLHTSTSSLPYLGHEREPGGLTQTALATTLLPLVPPSHRLVQEDHVVQCHGGQLCTHYMNINSISNHTLCTCTVFEHCLLPLFPHIKRVLHHRYPWYRSPCVTVVDNPAVGHNS